jgi:Domain of unknown function (DUF4333)
MKKLVLLLAIFALALVGCGETVLDATKTEEQITAEFEKAGSGTITSVECPSDIEVKAGTKFDCTVSRKGAAETTVTLKITNEDADLEVVDPGKAFDDSSS